MLYSSLLISTYKTETCTTLAMQHDLECNLLKDCNFSLWFIIFTCNTVFVWTTSLLVEFAPSKIKEYKINKKVQPSPTLRRMNSKKCLHLLNEWSQTLAGRDFSTSFFTRRNRKDSSSLCKLTNPVF